MMNRVNPELLKERGFVEVKSGVWEKSAAPQETGGATGSIPKVGKEAFKSLVAKIRGESPPRARRPRTAKLERRHADAPGTAAQGSEASTARFIVRVICFRSRLLDDDNVCEKFVVDGLRYAGLLPDDRHKQARIITWQEPCQKGEERTEVTLIRRQ